MTTDPPAPPAGDVRAASRGGPARTRRSVRPRGVRALSWIAWLAFAGWAAAGLGGHAVDNDLADWMPELATEGATASWVVVGLGPGDPDPLRVAAALRARPEIGLVLDPATVAAAAAAGGPAPAGLTGSPGDEHTAIWAFAAAAPADENAAADEAPRAGGTRSVDDAALVAAAEAALAEVGAPVPPVPARPLRAADDDGPRLAGPAVFRLAMNAWSQEGLDRIAAVQFGLGIALLWLVTGRLGAAAGGAIAIALVQVVLLGLFARHDTPLDLSLSLVPPLVAALGYAFAAHRAARRRVGVAIAASCATTMAGVLVFAVGGLLPLLRFATWGALGIGLVALATWMLVPGPRGGASPFARRGGLAAHVRRGTHRLVLHAAPRRPATALAIAGGVLVLGALATPHLRFETDPLHAFPRDARVRTDFERLDAEVAGMLPFELRLDPQDRGFDPVATALSTPGVRRVIAIPGAPGRWWGLASNDAVAPIGAAADDWKAAARAAGATLEVRGVAPTLAAIGTTVRRTAAISIPVMVLVAAAAGLVIARSLRVALAAGLVNAVPAAGLVLVAAGLDLGLNLPSLLVAAIAVGAGIDDTVHLLVAARRGAGGGRRALARCAPACLGSTVVAAAAMSAFMLAGFAPVRQFGALMATTLVLAVLADLLLLPALLPRPRVRAR